MMTDLGAASKTAKDTSSTLPSTHEDHEFSGCSGTVCCAGYCAIAVLIRDSREILAVRFPVERAKITVSLAPSTPEHPPRLTA
ncbi:hypothetical protein [Rhodobacter lacus]|uniref:Uncharacterized protein n=1 Tax=Rhodobacter lacus TaxID=1641972 RepID=A0ABW5AB49_9RHOB